MDFIQGPTTFNFLANGAAAIPTALVMYMLPVHVGQ